MNEYLGVSDAETTNFRVEKRMVKRKTHLNSCLPHHFRLLLRLLALGRRQLRRLRKGLLGVLLRGLTFLGRCASAEVEVHGTTTSKDKATL
jgi:hypothetical protein